MQRVSEMDKRVYLDYLAELQQSTIEPSTSDYVKYVISAYAYFRSRLLIPGRCYEDDNHGAMAIGGSAHADVIDLDIWLSQQGKETIDEAVDWIKGSSLEQVAYWRGLGRKNRGTISRRRKKIAISASKNGTKSTTVELAKDSISEE